MRARLARHTDKLEEVVAFYRDGVGLPEIGRFAGHDGYDGVFLDLPGTGAHLEFTTGGEHAAAEPHPENLLVLYVDDEASLTAIAERIGNAPVRPVNPYWQGRATTFADPDGWQLVLVGPSGQDDPAEGIDVEEHSGPRAELRPLFELAESSARQLDAYIGAGRVLVARDGGPVLGHLQLVETGDPDRLEIKNMAVLPSHQRRGIGRALVDAAVALARAEARSALAVATAAADVGDLRFYQRLGFRMRSIERDAFTEDTGYEGDLRIDGIELRDRVWLDLRIDGIELRDRVWLDLRIG